MRTPLTQSESLALLFVALILLFINGFLGFPHLLTAIAFVVWVIAFSLVCCAWPPSKGKQ